MPDPSEKRGDGLTVLIRSRNQRAALPRALRGSLDALGHLEKEGFRGEILVVDAASRDGSQKLLRTVQALYNEPRLRTLRLGKRLDPAGLREIGLRESALRHVCVMDADNELLPENLPLFLRSIVDTGAAMVYGNLVDKEGGEVKGVRSNMPAIPRLNKTSRIGSCFLLDTKESPSLETADEVDPQGSEGWNLALHLLADEKLVVLVPLVLGYHHEHPASEGGEPQAPDGETAQPQQRRSRTGGRRSYGRTGRNYHPDVGFLDE